MRTGTLLDVQEELAAHVSESLIPRESPDRADGFVTVRIIGAFEAARWSQCDGYAGDPGASAPRCESYRGHPGRHFIDWRTT